jgi:hypothetical protein
MVNPVSKVIRDLSAARRLLAEQPGERAPDDIAHLVHSRYSRRHTHIAGRTKPNRGSRVPSNSVTAGLAALQRFTARR